jgi:hypothetical protein
MGGVVMQLCYAIALVCQCYEGSGGGEIRTHEAFRPSGFQDRRNQPLCHPSRGRLPRYFGITSGISKMRNGEVVAAAVSAAELF